MHARPEPGWLSLAELFSLCSPKENQLGKPNYDEFLLYKTNDILNICESTVNPIPPTPPPPRHLHVYPKPLTVLGTPGTGTNRLVPRLSIFTVNKMADEDGFQVVKKRKGHKNKICRENNGTSITSSFYTSSEITICDVNELRTKIDKCRQDFSL